MGGIEDRTTGLRADVVGFYVSCTVFSLAAALAAFAFIVAGDLFDAPELASAIGWTSVVVGVLSSFTTYWYLRRMRQRTGG